MCTEMEFSPDVSVSKGQGGQGGGRGWRLGGLRLALQARWPQFSAQGPMNVWAPRLKPPPEGGCWAVGRWSLERKVRPLDMTSPPPHM